MPRSTTKGKSILALFAFSTILTVGKVDLAKLSELGNYASNASANAMWHKLRQKLQIPTGVTKKGDGKDVSPTKTPRGKAIKTETDDNDNDEPKSVKKTPARAAKGKAKGKSSARKMSDSEEDVKAESDDEIAGPSSPDVSSGSDALVDAVDSADEDVKPKSKAKPKSKTSRAKVTKATPKSSPVKAKGKAAKAAVKINDAKEFGDKELPVAADTGDGSDEEVAVIGNEVVSSPAKSNSGKDGVASVSNLRGKKRTTLEAGNVEHDVEANGDDAGPVTPSKKKTRTGAQSSPTKSSPVKATEIVAATAAAEVEESEAKDSEQATQVEEEAVGSDAAQDGGSVDAEGGPDDE